MDKCGAKRKSARRPSVVNLQMIPNGITQGTRSESSRQPIFWKLSDESGER